MTYLKIVNIRKPHKWVVWRVDDNSLTLIGSSSRKSLGRNIQWDDFIVHIENHVHRNDFEKYTFDIKTTKEVFVELL